MNTKQATQVASALLIVVAILHGYRAIQGWVIEINAWELPVWVSAVAFFAVGYLGYQLWKSVK